MNRQKNILVTGGAGFIGLHFINYLMEKYPQYKILNLDKLTYAANLKELHRLEESSHYIFVKGDICDEQLVKEVFAEYQINGVVHLAAESHVDRSIKDPKSFIETNVLGTFTLLEAAKHHWLPSAKDCRFLHVSTDEVYGTLGESGLFSETTAYAPNSPYSASKASSDFLVRSYFHTFGLNTVITHCSNNFGPMQHGEKLIPTIIRKALEHKRIPIYGDGKHTRDWLFVRDHCRGLDLAFHGGKDGKTYNIGGRNERTNIEIAEKTCEMLDQLAPIARKATNLASYKELITLVSDRPGHDRRYAIDASKIERELGWKAEEPFESGLRRTVEWYVNEFKRMSRNIYRDTRL